MHGGAAAGATSMHGAVALACHAAIDDASKGVRHKNKMKTMSGLKHVLKKD